MPTELIDERFAKTLVGDYEGDVPWRAVHDLRRIASRDVFDKARERWRQKTPWSGRGALMFWRKSEER